MCLGLTTWNKLINQRTCPWKKKILPYISSHWIKLTKEVKKFRSENFKSLKRKSRKILEYGKTSQAPGFVELTYLKITIFPNTVCKFKVISKRLCMTLFTKILKVILNKEINTGWVSIPYFNLYYRVIVIETVWTNTKADVEVNEAKKKMLTWIHNIIHLILTAKTKLPTDKKSSSTNNAGQTKCPHLKE